MVGTFTILVVVVLIIAIWLIIDLKRMRHKFFAFFLIFLILFGVFSFGFVLSGKNINYKSVSGISEAGKIYFTWLGSVFGNMKSITTNAIKMNWKGNETKTG